MLGIRGTPPHKRGNCFSVITDNGGERKEYRIVNFNFENLEALLSKGLTWPIRIMLKSPTVAIIYDTRIPYNWYQEQYCTTCCPHNLLPEPQQVQNILEMECGFQIREQRSIRYDYSKQPMLENLK